jgi:L-amino acid N-acyltransferase YncA
MAAEAAETLIRPPADADAADIGAIYNAGIEGRQATFQTELHSPGRLEQKTAARGGRMLVAERDGVVAGFASWTGYDDPAPYYAGVGECAVYVAPAAQRAGVGRILLEALCEEADRAGLHKLVAKIFSTNKPSIDLFHRCGFDDVGVHRRHGRLDGQWKDVLVVERLLGDAGG